MPLESTVISSAPITGEATPPQPPLKEAPPTTAAAMLSSMRLPPRFGSPEPVRAVNSSAPQATSAEQARYAKKRQLRTGSPAIVAARGLLPIKNNPLPKRVYRNTIKDTDNRIRAARI